MHAPREVFQASMKNSSCVKYDDIGKHNIVNFLKNYVNPALYTRFPQQLYQDSTFLFSCLDKENGINTRKYVKMAITNIVSHFLPLLISSNNITISSNIEYLAIQAYKDDNYYYCKRFQVPSLVDIAIEHIRDNYDTYKDKLYVLPSELREKIVLCNCKVFNSKHFDKMLKYQLHGTESTAITKSEAEYLGIAYTQLDNIDLDVYELNSIYYLEISQRIVLKKISDDIYCAKCFVVNNNEIEELDDEKFAFCDRLGIDTDQLDDDEGEIILNLIENLDF